MFTYALKQLAAFLVDDDPQTVASAQSTVRQVHCEKLHPYLEIPAVPIDCSPCSARK